MTAEEGCLIYQAPDRSGPSAATVAAEEHAASQRDEPEYRTRWVMGAGFDWVRRRVYRDAHRVLPYTPPPPSSFEREERIATLRREVESLRRSIDAALAQIAPEVNRAARRRNAAIREQVATWRRDIGNLGSAL